MSDYSVFNRMAALGHEQVIFCRDRETGLKAIIAIHDTRLGPARGGTRFSAYPDEAAALEDALRLARGMTYKFASTDMPRGGGKAVILAEPGRFDRRVLMRVYGRFVEMLGGRFGTGPDLGTSAADMAAIASQTSYVQGVPEGAGGTGDPAAMTARGVIAGMEAALDGDSLADMRVAVQGLGSIGAEVARRLVERGASVVAADIDAARAREVAGRLGLELAGADAIYDVDCDVFSPNAAGGVLAADTIERLRCRLVAGGANNQLATPEDGGRLHERGIVYAPDYVINCGGAYLVAGQGELGYSTQRVESAVDGIAHIVRAVIDRAAAEDRPTSEVADEMAEALMFASARARSMSDGRPAGA